MWRLVLSISPEVPIFRTAVSAPLHSRTVSSVITRNQNLIKVWWQKIQQKYSKWLQFLANWKWTLKQHCYSIDPVEFLLIWTLTFTLNIRQVNTQKHSKTPTLLCLYDDTHSFPGGVKLQNMKQLIPPHLSVECHLQMVVSHSMENNTIPEAMHKLLFLISSFTTIHQIIIELNSRV